MPMRVLHTVAAIEPKSGGPTRSVVGLCRALAAAEVDTTLFVQWPMPGRVDLNGAHFRTCREGGRRAVWREINQLIAGLKPDIIHLHGLWMWQNHISFLLACRHRIPVVLSPRGMLDPWALRQKAFKKRLAMLLYQRWDLMRVTTFHATADQEAHNIRARKLNQPIFVIPNGVDIPETLPVRQPRADGLKTALFLSRLHPGKGLLDLVAAWARVKPQGWTVRIVGPDVCGHQAEVQAEIERLGLTREFTFVGEKNDAEKWQEYANADLFVHPSRSENFGISIAEALAAGLPVITTKGTPWSELLGTAESAEVLKCGSSKVEEEALAETGVSGNQSCESCELCAHAVENPVKTPPAPPPPRTPELPNSRTLRTSRCGWWIDIGVEPLASALQEAIDLPDDARRRMGQNGRQLIADKYTWPRVAEQMKTAYNQSLW